jgi:hypothetical protein
MQRLFFAVAHVDDALGNVIGVEQTIGLDS